MTNPKLSPAAQAVLEAYNEAPHDGSGTAKAVAALRAAAPYIDDASDGLECQDILRQIADELENHRPGWPPLAIADELEQA